MIRIAFLTDLHFGAHRQDLVRSLLEDVAGAVPDAVAIGGDLTHRAAPAEFEQAAAFLAALPAPLLTVPGNHDIPGNAFIERLLDPRRRWRRFIGENTEQQLLLPGFALIGLDTVRRMQLHWDWSAGGVTAAGRERLADRLRDLAGRVVVVLAHHPMLHPGWAARRAGPFGAKGALTAMADGGVLAVLSGHLHRPAVLTGKPILVIGGSALSHRVSVVPNSWTLVEVEAGAVTTTLRVATDTGWQDAVADPLEVAAAL